MRTLLQNTPKLLYLLDIIEEWLGYPIATSPMPQEHKALARCSMSRDNGRWFLLLDTAGTSSPSTLCHELMHMVLFAEGFPAFSIPPIWRYNDYRNQVLQMLCNLVPHLEVWRLTEAYGFSEATDYDPGNRELLRLVQSSLFVTDAEPNLAFVVRGTYLAQGLLCPGLEGTHKRLRDAAYSTMPRALELADSILSVFEHNPPVSPPACEAGLYRIFEILQVPKEILTVSYADKILPNAREHILHIGNQGKAQS